MAVYDILRFQYIFRIFWLKMRFELRRDCETFVDFVNLTRRQHFMKGNGFERWYEKKALEPQYRVPLKRKKQYWKFNYSLENN